MRLVIEVDATPEEVDDLTRRLRELLQQIRSGEWDRRQHALAKREMEVAYKDLTGQYKSTLALDDPDRFTVLPAVDDYGQHEAIDNRTGRRGMLMPGFGFVPGAHVCADGRVVFEYPWNNPLQGCDWGG